LKEQSYFGGKLGAEIEVDPESYLYNGKEITYADDNSVSGEGTWSEGKLNGEWKVYDSNGGMVRVTVYDKGNFVSRKVKVDGQWVEKRWEDLPFIVKWRIKKYQAKRGPDIQRE
jgi:hypothetical protein